MNWKIFVFILLLILFIYIDYRYSNVFVRMYNYTSKLPKIMIILVVILLIVSPALLKNNMILDCFRDYMPDSLVRKMDDVKVVQQVNQLVNQKGGRVSTKFLRKVTEQTKKFVAAGQGWKCKKCGATLSATYEVDHIVPLEDGGGNEIQNLRAVCRNCHGNITMMNNLNRKYPNGKLG